MDTMSKAAQLERLAEMVRELAGHMVEPESGAFYSLPGPISGKWLQKLFTLAGATPDTFKRYTPPTPGEPKQWEMEPFAVLKPKPPTKTG